MEAAQFNDPVNLLDEVIRRDSSQVKDDLFVLYSCCESVTSCEIGLDALEKGLR